MTTLSKRALDTIATVLLDHVGKQDLFITNKAGLKTLNEIDDFVFKITGKRMARISKTRIFQKSLIEYVQNSIHEDIYKYTDLPKPPLDI